MPGQGIKVEKTKVTILLDGVNQLPKLKRKCFYSFITIFFKRIKTRSSFDFLIDNA